MVVLFVAKLYLDQTDRTTDGSKFLNHSMIFITSSKHVELFTEYCPGAGMGHSFLQHHFRTRTKNVLLISLERDLFYQGHNTKLVSGIQEDLFQF